MSKRFIHFKTKENFLNNIPDVLSIAFILDTKEIWTHGTLYCVDPEYSLSLDSEASEDGKKYIRLVTKAGDTLGKIDTADFVKDGMINSVSFDAEGEDRNLTLTFNTEAGLEPIVVSLKGLVDVYDGSNIYLKSIEIPETYSAPAANDTVDVAIANLMKKDSDLASAILDAKEELEESLENLANNVASTAYAGIKNGTDGNFVTTTIADKGEDNKQEISVSVNAVKISEVKSITDENGPVDGLAIASDVKDYFAWEELD